MPDPVEWLLAVLAAASSSAAAMLAFGRWRTKRAATNAASTLACVAGIALGYAILKLHPAWPPASALDRLLALVLPAVVIVELLAAVPWMPGEFVLVLRIVLALAMGRVLLHGSVYLSQDGGGSDNLTTAWLLVGGLGIAGCWHLLLRLNRREPNWSLPIALGLAIACAGAAILLAGYIRGGESALPLAAALAATGLASAVLKPQQAGEGVIGVGVFGLAGLLIVGHFFGRLTTVRALTIFSAPLLCWTAELPAFRVLKSWQTVALRLLLVAIPLVVALALAAHDFRREMQQLLVSS